jgi:hypothetical protein
MWYCWFFFSFLNHSENIGFVSRFCVIVRILVRYRNTYSIIPVKIYFTGTPEFKCLEKISV